MFTTSWITILVSGTISLVIVAVIFVVRSVASQYSNRPQLIPVYYPDFRLDYVNAYTLDSLIEANRIAKFKRRTGWVTLGVDPVRSGKRDHASFKGTCLSVARTIKQILP